MKVLGLRELLCSLKKSYGAAGLPASADAGLVLALAAREKTIDEGSAQEDDHEVDQDADQEGHVGERSQDERGSNGCKDDSEPVHRFIS